MRVLHGSDRDTTRRIANSRSETVFAILQGPVSRDGVDRTRDLRGLEIRLQGSDEQDAQLSILVAILVRHNVLRSLDKSDGRAATRP